MPRADLVFVDGELLCRFGRGTNCLIEHQAPLIPVAWRKSVSTRLTASRQRGQVFGFLTARGITWSVLEANAGTTPEPLLAAPWRDHRVAVAPIEEGHASVSTPDPLLTGPTKAVVRLGALATVTVGPIPES